MFKSNELTTSCGKFRYKYSVRAAFRSVTFVALVAGFCVYNQYSKYNANDEMVHRRLATPVVENESNWDGIFQVRADPTWTIILYILGILYMFLALAIVCDEYFVPALEEMSGEHQMNMPLDIAGATLMAAGGSAPELFTSLFGTFAESSVGFGTIVGSATFNVLFVIGMCSLLSKETLHLTWWPLFRDCIYYAVSLLILAIFVGVVSPEVIELWEAVILFVMYFGYVGVMAMNERLYKGITGKDLYPQDEEAASSEESFYSFKYHTTFRAGLLTLIQEPDSWLDKARIGLVSKIAGNVDEVFAFVDENDDGTISREELQKCFNKLEDQPVPESELDQIMGDLDKNRNGRISKSEFKTWYLRSEQHVKGQIRKVFERYDKDSSGTIYPTEFQAMLQEIEPSVTAVELNQATTECYSEHETKELSFNEFAEWYFKSTYYEKQQRKVEREDSDKTLCDVLSPPKGATAFQMMKYIALLPLVATLALTIPDVRRKSVHSNFCYVAFFLSIAWIGVYSYFMVGWAETVGETVGIPSYIMGLTFLAAGTSVPDLITSVIVARMGEGNMAVSSSIGSNLFDILVGLPLPWIIYIAWPSTKSTVEIGADGIWLSIMILLAMLVIIIVTIHFSGWRLTKTLGFFMFFFYFLFLLQAILREYM